MKSELDLFSMPQTQLSIESSIYGEYYPVTSLNDGSTIEFEVTGTGEDYIDLTNTYLKVKTKVTQANGDNLENDDMCAPVCYFLHALFSQVDIFLNGKQITSSTGTYAYRAIIEALLSYGEEAKRTQLAAALFHKDAAGRMDEVTAGDVANSGFVKRRQLSRNSRVLDLMGRLHADIFFQERYLLNNVDLKIRLTRSKDSFCLMSANEGRIVKILGAQLLVRKVRLSPSIALAHAKTLEVSTAKYPLRRVVCKTFTIPSGVRDVNQEKLFTGQLPTRLVIGFVANRAFSGAYNLNPFNFMHCNLSEICIHLDGQQGHAIRPLKLDFTNKQFVEAYLTLFTGTGKINRDESNSILLEDFGEGYALFCYDLSPDLCEGDHLNLLRQGNVRLAVKFSEALGDAVTAIAYAEFENCLEIDRSRNILFDYS